MAIATASTWVVILTGVAVHDVDALSKIPHLIGLHSDL